ncbi:MAG: NUDIX hydrolase [Microgenomates group bacterium]
MKNQKQKIKIKFETSAGGIVYKKSTNEWLVVQHSQHKGWVFPKGLVGDKKINEKMEEAALREVEEEGGVKAKIVYNKPVKVSYMYRFNEYLIKKTVYYFLMEYITGDPKNHDWEVSQAKFLPAGEVKKILTYESDKEAFEKILTIFQNYFLPS